ncbi:MAG: hypothetical protein ND895_25810 [Pyrinomonadaceae bacterium]|nr:hypothetical protein [Pyrinomonadaceae bacterium]
MLASIDEVIKVLKSAKPPAEIWQEPYDHDSNVYRRLCSLSGAEPEASDLRDYSQSMLYTPLQPDLFRHLLPICLQAWRKDLFSDEDSNYGGFAEHFSTALATRRLLEEILTADEYRSVMEYILNSILDRIDREDGLHFIGMGARPYRWFLALGSFSVTFSSLHRLWESWWSMSTTGHALAALQYLSCLMYEDDRNPIFSPWTPDGGGGPPPLYETDGHIYDRGWRPENISFLEATLTPVYLETKLHEAAKVVEDHVHSNVPAKMIADFDAQRELIESRINQLPTLLSTSVLEVSGWLE